MYLQRHGESETNVNKLFTCRRLDPSLTEDGRQQIERKVRFYRQADIQEIVTSPSRRAVQSAEILGEALGVGITTDDALLEVDIGNLEGSSEHDPDCLNLFLGVLSDWLRDGKNTRFPGGESRQEVEARIQRAMSLGSLSTLLVGHATFFAVLMGKAGFRFLQIVDLFLPRAGTARYSENDGSWEMIDGAKRVH